jgi:hypothetical protein
LPQIVAIKLLIINVGGASINVMCREVVANECDRNGFVMFALTGEVERAGF